MSSSGARGVRREYGRTYVVRPKGRHLATIVWLHGIGDNGNSWSQVLGNLPLDNVKWICPTAPTRPVAAFGGFPCTAWFDVEETSVDGPDDVQGLDASAAHIANLLSSEPSDAHIRILFRTLRTKIESSQTAFRRAAALPIMLGHGRGDEVVTYRNGERSAEFLRNSGFSYLNFKAYNGLGHHTIPEEMDDVSKWLRARLGLDRSCG
ncbi:unnamed protein product [Triticum turgidum subsp. durum]|uniref:Phospholipase/carboxylesterase/thioesterase domain-containing protein n=1 Tax=Triticum turgidum subsp. durum TaxID=4567 RepID=A0A9R1S1D9_TRITD|nr:unnamed protein product [Triticum turgidum subsp. durum]